MSQPDGALFQLLPAIHRAKDEERSGALRALLAIIGEQVEIVENDISQLYDNWFVETCEPWVLPYIAELIGAEALTEPVPASDRSGGVQISRRDLANTIRMRRRKGTLHILDELALATTAWGARAVEGLSVVSYTRQLKSPQPGRLPPAGPPQDLASSRGWGRQVDLRQGLRLERLDGPFDEIAHRPDLRRIGRAPGRGPYRADAVALYLWRLRSHSVTSAPANAHERSGGHTYTFSVLGNDSPLFTRGARASEDLEVSSDREAPSPITRRALERALTDYYGPARDFAIWVQESRAAGPRKLLPPERLVTADLSDWQYRPAGQLVAVDPVLGRIAFAPGKRPRAVWVSYHEGASADFAAGEYPRRLLDLGELTADANPVPAPTARTFRVGEGESLTSIPQALAAWQLVRETVPHAIVEIVDSGVYGEPFAVELDRGETLQLRAASRRRPVIYLDDRHKNASDALPIVGKTGGRFLLDGVIVAGRGLRAEGLLDELTIRHCTLVPGWELGHDCKPRAPAEPSLELYSLRGVVFIEKSIIGSIQVYADEVRSDPVAIEIVDSVVDATALDGEAIGAPGWPAAHARLTFRRCTVVGTVAVHAIELAENTLFLSEVRVARRQIGCVRFCFVPPGSRTPRRFHCQPDLTFAAIDAAGKLDNTLDVDGEKALALERVSPRFDSLRYGTPTYARLALSCAPEIAAGADNRSEMGVFNDLYQPQRLASLQARLAEFTVAGMDSGVVLVT